MSDTMEQEKPRKLLRWAEDADEDANQGPGDENNENTNEGSEEGASEKSGANFENPEATVPPKRGDWYGTKMKRLKDNLEMLRQELRNKERDNVRLKNKYNVSKRKQEQLQEDLKKHTEVKLDTDSEVELLRMQLLEKEKELSQYSNYNTDNASRQSEKGGKTTLEGDCGIESDVETPLESCLDLGDSLLARKYLKFDKDGRRWFVYVVLGSACVFSVFALGVASHILSSLAVGLWTLGLFFLWQERKDLFRTMKLKHLKKVRDISVAKTQLVEEKRKLETRKDELERELTNELKDKEVTSLEFTELNEKFDEATARNVELAKREKTTFEELQGERVRRRRAEEQLAEASARALQAKEEDELLKCGDVCRKLQESLKFERDEKEKLGRENQRLIEEIVAINMKEEKARTITEKKEMDEKVDENERKGKKESVMTQTKNEKENDARPSGEIKSEETKAEKNESKIDPSTVPKMESRPETQAKSSVGSQTSPQKTEVNVPNGGLIIGVPAKHCVLCSLKVSTVIRMAILYIVFLVSLVLLLKFVFSSKIHFFTCLLFTTLAGALGYYCVAMVTTGSVSGQEKLSIKDKVVH